MTLSSTFLHVLMPMLVLGLGGCNPLPFNSLLDVKSARLLTTVKRLADYGHLDNSMNVQSILDTTLSVQEHEIPGASEDDCRDNPARTFRSRTLTYAPASHDFWFVEDPSLPSGKFQPKIEYSVDHRTTCRAAHTGEQAETTVHIAFIAISPYVCISAYDLNVAIPHLVKSLALDSFTNQFFYKPPREDILVSFTYQHRGKCLYAIELEQSSRARLIRSHSFFRGL